MDADSSPASPADEHGPHIPVLAAELVAAADPATAETIVDGTFGAGGHARLLCAQLPKGARYVGVDRDQSVATHAAAVAAEFPEIAVELRHDTFADALGALAREGVSASVVILDVGVSSMQLDRDARGFSYSRDAPLDMRMDQSRGPTAADLVAHTSADDLAALLRRGGAEREAWPVAQALAAAADAGTPPTTTFELAELVEQNIPGALRKRRGHPAKRVFQALRIAVNDELGQLEHALPAAFELLEPGGRLVVISFHSAEDRLVKRYFRTLCTACTCPPDFPVCTCGGTAQAEHVIRGSAGATDAELAVNPRSASARIRAIRRLE